MFLWASGCALVPTTQQTETQSSLAIHEQHLAKIGNITDFNVKGRIGVQTNPKGFSGSLNWQHTPQQDSIALYSPLGGQVAEIEKTPQFVTLKDSNGNVMTEKDAETLTEKTLGWQLPLNGLSDWVLGRPSASVISSSDWDGAGKLRNLTQDGWRIQYVEYQTVADNSLPSKINLFHPKVTIKLILQHVNPE